MHHTSHLLANLHINHEDPLVSGAFCQRRALLSRGVAEQKSIWALRESKGGNNDSHGHRSAELSLASVQHGVRQC